MIILLVAFVLLFVVTAFAALAIDLVTFYTARSEAQLAADSTRWPEREPANSGMTSDLVSESEPRALSFRTRQFLATAVATQVATSNQVGGKTLTGGTCPGAEVSVNFHDFGPILWYESSGDGASAAE